MLSAAEGTGVGFLYRTVIFFEHEIILNAKQRKELNMARNGRKEK